ncbi:Leucine--tRNA ligase [Halomonadaceae bacterium LMG 33818]|uniref:leucine--tRNA ligase n=1 Tax=Cernens ardua TaxID=3402176 RepID=UPI003EDB8220
MDAQYSPSDVERKAQQFWETNSCFKAVEDPDREKFYCLCMFPYPSGNLHSGHVRNYTLGDVISRFQRMNGKSVLQPMGWDAFGMPAENAAIKNKVPPAEWTYSNINNMRKQLKSLGFAYDWDREFATCDKDYYRWEQWFFSKLVEKGLVYKKNSTVNWDPVDQTVLANEQVIDGRGWRSGALIERREIPSWFLKITDYAEELLADLENLEWPEQVKTMQRNWIGKSKGLELDFHVPEVGEANSKLTVFTTRPDTLMGVSYVAIAADHPLARLASELNPELLAFREECRAGGASEADLATMDKKGMDTGYRAEHPITGELLPIYVANFVLMEYGTGAVMAVPAHDQRDWEFATKYGLPIKPVVSDLDGLEPDVSEEAYTDYGQLINSGDFDELLFDEAFDAIAKLLEKEGKGRVKINFRLRDWGVSRQRYWGAPIPIKYGPEGETVALTDDELPVALPKEVEIDPTGGSPLKKMRSFYDLGDGWTRETDTFDTFMESSWYYARFCCSDNHSAMLDERANYWLPVDTYIGGIEHAILHLLYARFFHKLMRDFGLIDSNEPFKKLITQGMVTAETFYREEEDGSRTWFNPLEVTVNRDEKGRPVSAVLTRDGEPVVMGGIEKMSKSKNNGVDPQPMIEQFGADTVRLFIMFAAPPEQSLEWSDSGVEGAHRFIKRLWKLTYEHLEHGEPGHIVESELNENQRDLHRKTHETIQKCTDDLGRRYVFNTAIAAVMELTNVLGKFDDTSLQGLAVEREAVEACVLLLSPIIPHVCHTLWEALGHEEPVIDAAWPEVNEKALKRDSITMVVQVNGKLRAQLELPADADRVKIECEALSNENVQRHVEGKSIQKVVVVPGKLVNIVAN